jgi:hypothetical protein
MNLRLYPDFFPQIEGEATSDAFEIQDLNGMGRALASKRPFNAGSKVFCFTGIVLPYVTQWTLEINSFVHIEDKYVMGLVPHSCDPNCYVDMHQMAFIAVRDIESGDRVTMDYDQTESRLFANFKCSCGTDKCRGYI